MAILGKIRKRTGLLLGFTVVALFLFLAGDLFSNITNFFKGDPNVFGKINGDKITRSEYMEQIQAQEQFKQQIPDLHNRVWEDLIRSKIIQQKFNNAKFVITEKMIWNEAEKVPYIVQNPQFQVNGKFSSQKLQEYYQLLFQNQRLNEETYQQFIMFENFKKGLEAQVMQNLYFNSYGNAMLTNKREIDIYVENKTNNATIDYIKIAYDTYPGRDSIKVTDDDIKEYENKYRNLFKIDDNVTLDYSYFSFAPSEKDIEKVKNEINLFLKENSIIDSDTIQGSFRTTKHPDSLALLYSAVPMDNSFRVSSQLSIPIREWVKTASVGQIFGPYENQGYFYLSRLEGKKILDSVHLKQIVISYNNTIENNNSNIKRNREQAKFLSDSLINIIKNNSSTFGDLAVKFSDDPYTASNQGDASWVLSNVELPTQLYEVNDFIQKANKGTVKSFDINSQGGSSFVIFYLADRKPAEEAYKVIDLANQIKASEETERIARQQSDSFIKEVLNKSSEDFKKVAENSKYPYIQEKGVLRFSTVLKGIKDFNDNEQIMIWAFDKKRKEGDVTKFNFLEGYAVVKLSGIYKKGLKDPSLVRSEQEDIIEKIRNQKIAKILIERINSSNKTLDQLATDFKTEKSSATVSFSYALVGNSIEPKVGGAAFGLKEGKQSKAIEGESGVFVIIPKSIIKSEGDKTLFKDQLLSQYSKGLPMLFMNSLRESANVVDFRNEVMNVTEQ